MKSVPCLPDPSVQEAGSMSTPEKPEQPSADRAKSDPPVQGEGDYESARRFDADARRFLDSADVPELARRAAPRSKEEAAQLKEAEAVGRSHAVGGKEEAAGSATDTQSPPKPKP
jgi:hypothetical protein